MSLVSDHNTPAPAISMATAGDYFALMKPRVMSLVVFTALVGIVLAPAGQHPLIAAVALLLIAVGAGASGALNMWYDADIDQVMVRTRGRPIPAGKITRGEAFAFGITLSVGATLFLGLFTNWLAGGLLGFTIFFYVAIYTMWLKRKTEQNIVIGGAAGAFPPMVGYAAMTGTISIEGIVLFIVIFMWTPPHFWALALLKERDYGDAGVPMMPNASGSDKTRQQIVIYTAIYLATTFLPVIAGFAGLLYLVGNVALSGLFALATWRVFQRRDGEAGETAARQLFAFSILQLFLVFTLLLAEAGFGLRFAIPGFGT
jgi:heme o synthase